MKKLLSFIILLVAIFRVSSQEIPKIKIGEKEISVQKIKIETSIIGDIAFTTYDMHFYNSNNRVLEGELIFPLAENQSVHRFALDINGNLREAVVVEKEKARVAFESTVRRRIDPALLEKTKGNNYKARIYPIPAKGYKRIVVGIQQKLLLNNDSYYYKVPLNFTNKLEEFSLAIKILNQKNKPIVKKGMISSFTYNSKKGTYYAYANSKKEKVTQPVLIKIPLNTNKEKIIANRNYFYVSKKLDLEGIKTSLNKKITIFWDASLSQKNKKITSELSLLDTYFKEIQNGTVDLVVFSDKIREKKRFIIRNGVWDSLKEKLNTIIYDGGSSFHFLNNYTDNSKSNLLFTDGLNTLDNLDIKFTKKTFIINSSLSANHLILKDKAITSGGNYINLQQVSIKKAFEKFREQKLQFLGTDYSENILEVYPKKGSVITENFFVIGKGNIIGKEVKLYFGNGNKIVKTKTIFIEKEQEETTYLSKIWAQNKLNVLAVDKENNEPEIVKLSKEYQIISPFTSMLILDRVEDYVQHEIVPPNDLLEVYNRLMAQKVNNKKERLASLQNRLFTTYEDFFHWYKKDFEIKNERKHGIKNKAFRSQSPPPPPPPNRIEIVEDDVEVEETVIEVIEEHAEEEIIEVDEPVSMVRMSPVSDTIGRKKLKARKEEINSGISKTKPVYVVDGKLIEGVHNLERSEIHSSYTLTPQEGQAIYGAKAAVGIVVIITREGQRNNRKTIEDFEKLVKEKTELKGWNPKTPYLEILNKTATIKEAYNKYLELRENYGSSPSFYIDVADFFKKKNETETAIQILTNVAEIDLDNYELLKALAYKFEAYELHEYAVFIYKEILRLRPEDMQSYRDLALAYECIQEYQKSVDLLYQIVNGELLEKDENRRFSGIEAVALVELNRLIQLHTSKLQTQHFEERFIKEIQTDIRVVIDWNHNDTDIDLWVIDPTGEKCYYGHKKTKIGGLMSQDMTRGFGPEQFVLKKAMKGKYQLKVKYYSKSQQKISGPTFLKVTTFKNYGKKNEIKTTQLVRLKDAKEVLDIGNFFFD